MNMNRFPALLLPFGLLLASSNPIAFAQTGSETLSCGEERDIEPGLMTERTYNRMNEAFEMIGEEEYDAAYQELDNLRNARLSDFEKASVEQALGFITARREQYEAAVRHFSEAVRLDQLPNQTHFEMILQIAQIYNALERYDKALEQLDFWFCVSTEEARKVAEVWVLKASLHLQKDDFREALSAMNRAIDIAEEVPESWYRLKLGILLELKEYTLAVDVAKILIEVNPGRKEYWSRLSGIYMALDEDRNAMATLQLAYRRGLLDRGSEFIQLAGLLQQADAPRLAAEVMQAGLEKGFIERTANHWEMTAGAWYEARELDRSLEAYEQAGELSDSGKIDFQRASILTVNEDWEGTLAAARRALQKGDLSESNEGTAHLLVGMAHFNLDNLDQAEQAFIRAANYGTLRTAAREWVNHIEQTRQRLASR